MNNFILHPLLISLGSFLAVWRQLGLGYLVQIYLVQIPGIWNVHFYEMWRFVFEVWFRFWFRFVSIGFVSFRLVSFRFVSISFRTLQVPITVTLTKSKGYWECIQNGKWDKKNVDIKYTMSMLSRIHKPPKQKYNSDCHTQRGFSGIKFKGHMKWYAEEFELSTDIRHSRFV
jgi:hypothetical protein